MNPGIGSQLGNYRLLKMLGSGGFAHVYLGEHIYLQRSAAIKVLHVTSALSGEDSKAFLVEAKTLASLDHPHIVRILEFGVEHDMPYLVMDYAPDNLRARYPTGTQIPLSSVISYVSQIASALQYAHDRRVIHRDVKPENMLLDQNHEVLLSDFGIARVIQNTAQSVDIAGTSYYMAPEQVQGRPAPASDQYALAVVVYQWLCGKFPFDGNMVEVVYKHMSMPPPSMRALVPTLPAAVESVVIKALAKEPAQRYSNVQQFASELALAAGFLPQVLAASRRSDGALLLPEPDILLSQAVAKSFVPGASFLPAQDDSTATQAGVPTEPDITVGGDDAPSMLLLPLFTPAQETQAAAPSSPSSPPFMLLHDADEATRLSEEAPSILLPPLFVPVQKPEPANTIWTPDAVDPFLPPSVAPVPDIQRFQQVPEEDIAQLATFLVEKPQQNDPSASLLLPPISSILQRAAAAPPAPLEQAGTLYDGAATIMVMHPSPRKFFISYHENDSHWANWLRWHLEQSNYLVLLPERANLPEIDLVSEMQVALTMADYIITVISSDYIETYRKQHASLALIQNGLGKILPVRVQECDRQIISGFFSAPVINLVGVNHVVVGKTFMESIHSMMQPPIPDRDPAGKRSKPPVSTIKVFLSYAREDKPYRQQLEKYLKALSKQYPTASWHDGEIVAGEDYAQTIEKQLSSAHIILLLVSQDFIASDYCYEEEMTKAMKRHDQDEARVIPIILRPSLWKPTPIGKLQALPTDGKAISTWSNEDEALLDIALGIRTAIEEMLRKISIANA